MESSKINQKTLLSFFTKQHLNEDPDVSASGSGTNSIPLPVTSDDKSGLPATAVSSSSVSLSSATPYIENVSKWPSIWSSDMWGRKKEAFPWLDCKNGSIWSSDMWGRKKEAFPWLDCKNGSLGYVLCSNVSHLGAFKKERTSISKEWSAFTITFSGSNKSAQLTSLRKKIFLHKQSAGHLTAETISAKADKETIENVCDKMNMSNLESTIKIFRSAYYLAKNDRPFSDHSELLELLKMNGVDIGVGLHSRFSATRITLQI
ncbi:hypothetical protein QE152_g39474 [Popillia japonica]|uniref:Uncharacterized protein n=1 Tax=Popillia japonica TaxID=7064 RepID=A0AAW1HU53_POPJA